MDAETKAKLREISRAKRAGIRLLKDVTPAALFRAVREFADREPFLRAIRAEPKDDLPRLVYADWLEERGYDRAAHGLRARAWIREQPDHEAKKALERLAEFAAPVSFAAGFVYLKRATVEQHAALTMASPVRPRCARIWAYAAGWKIKDAYPIDVLSGALGLIVDMPAKYTTRVYENELYCEVCNGTGTVVGDGAVDGYCPRGCVPF